MTKCEITNRDQLIDDYITGKLAQEERDKFDEHCFDCDDCFEELVLREEMVGLIREESDVLFADYLQKRKAKSENWFSSKLNQFKQLSLSTQPRWLYASAAIAVLIIFGLVVFNKLKSPVSADFYAANFEASPNLEDMVGQVFRSTYSLKVLSPEKGVNLKGEITFQWEIQYDGELYLKILNNVEDVIWEEMTKSNDYRFTNELAPGLYYWKLETEDRLLYVGKFFVKKPNDMSKP